MRTTLHKKRNDKDIRSNSSQIKMNHQRRKSLQYGIKKKKPIIISIQKLSKPNVPNESGHRQDYIQFIRKPANPQPDEQEVQ